MTVGSAKERCVAQARAFIEFSHARQSKRPPKVHQFPRCPFIQETYLK